jgi:transposase
MRQVKMLKIEQIKQLQAFMKDKESSGTETRRAQAILILCSGESAGLISSLTGYEKKYVFKLRKKYLEKGIEGLKTKKRKPKALLTKGQIKEIVKVVKTSKPNDFGINADFWSTAILGQLIEEQYGVKYKSRTSLYLIFREAKFSYHKPGTQYQNRDQARIDEWKEEIKNKLKEFDFKNDAVLLVEDEMVLTTQTTCQKVWLPQGEFPIVEVSNDRKRRCVYGFLNVFSGQEYAVKTESANSEFTCKALSKIGKLYPKKKIVIIWDNASWHKSKEVRKFLAQTKQHFHLINFPPYAPDENPQEHVWKAGREHESHNRFMGNIDKMTDRFVGYLNKTIFDYKFLDLKGSLVFS